MVQRKNLSLFFFKLARYFSPTVLFFFEFSMGYSRQIVVFRVHPSKPRGDPVARRVQRNRSLDGRHLSALSAQMTLLNHRSATPWTLGGIGLPVLAPCCVEIKPRTTNETIVNYSSGGQGRRPSFSVFHGGHWP